MDHTQAQTKNTLIFMCAHVLQLASAGATAQCGDSGPTMYSGSSTLIPVNSPPPPPSDGGGSSGFLWWPIVASVGGAAMLACCTFFAVAAYRRRMRKEDEPVQVSTAYDAAPPAADQDARDGTGAWPSPPARTQSGWVKADGVELQDSTAVAGTSRGASVTKPPVRLNWGKGESPSSQAAPRLTAGGYVTATSRAAGGSTDPPPHWFTRLLSKTRASPVSESSIDDLDGDSDEVFKNKGGTATGVEDLPILPDAPRGGQSSPATQSAGPGDSETSRKSAAERKTGIGSFFADLGSKLKRQSSSHKYTVHLERQSAMNPEALPPEVIAPTGLMPSDSVMRSLQSQSDIVELSRALAGAPLGSGALPSDPAMGAKSRLGGSEGGSRTEGPQWRLIRDVSEKWNTPGPRVSAGSSHSDAWREFVPRLTI